MAYPSKLIVPAQTGRLKHPAGFAASSPGDQFLVIASTESAEATLFFDHGTRSRRIAINRSIDTVTVSVDGDGNRLAFVEQGPGRLWVLDTDTGHDTLVEQESQAVACAFDARDRLWAVRVAQDGFVVELRASRSNDLLASATFSNAYFAGGGAAIRLGPNENSVLLETFSGQSEQEYYLCEPTPDGGFLVEHIPALDGDQYAFASRDGQVLISFDHTEPGVVSYGLPAGEEAARVPWPDYDEGVCEDERPGYDACFLDGTRLLAGSQEGRLFVFDTNTLKFRSEIHVDGFAPVPLSQKYPSLSDPGLVSDLIVFGRCGDSVIALFAKNHRAVAGFVALPIPALLDG